MSPLPAEAPPVAVSRPGGKPAWLRRRLPAGGACRQTQQLLRQQGLHTVCEAARCPNRWECFSHKTATFLINGDRCTRNCRFCAVPGAPPGPPDPREPARVAATARKMGLAHVVVTAVTRDDQPDGGAQGFIRTIFEIRRQQPEATIELLIPDFAGCPEQLQAVLAAGPDVLNHNLETVPDLYARARPQADYNRSLTLLAEAAAFRPEIPVKSGLMLGLGETSEDLDRTLKDLAATGCQLLTLGQYLQPTAEQLPVVEYLLPQTFEKYRHMALQTGFAAVAAGPLVRSSYRAQKMFQTWRQTHFSLKADLP